MTYNQHKQRIARIFKLISTMANVVVVAKPFDYNIDCASPEQRKFQFTIDGMKVTFIYGMRVAADNNPNYFSMDVYADTPNGELFHDRLHTEQLYCEATKLAEYIIGATKGRDDDAYDDLINEIWA